MLQLLRAANTELSISILCFKCFSKLLDQRSEDVAPFYPSLLALLVTLGDHEVGLGFACDVGRLLSCPLQLPVFGDSILLH